MSGRYHQATANPFAVPPPGPPHSHEVPSHTTNIQIPAVPVAQSHSMSVAGQGYLPEVATAGTDFQHQHHAPPVQEQHTIPRRSSIHSTVLHALNSFWGAAAVKNDIRPTQMDRNGYPTEAPPHQPNAQHESNMLPVGPQPNAFPSRHAPSLEGSSSAQPLPLSQVVRRALQQQSVGFPPDNNPFSIRPPAGWNATWLQTPEIDVKSPITVGECLYVLEQCTFLEKLECSLKSTSGCLPLRLPNRVLVANLLCLNVTLSTEPANLFDRVALPRLTSLHVQWDKQSASLPETDFGILNMLCAAESTGLQELVLIDLYPAEEELLSCLSCADKLTRLVVSADPSRRFSPAMLHGRMISRRILQQLGNPDRPSSLCPGLYGVELSPCHPHDDDYLVDMIRHRNRTQRIIYPVDSGDKRRHMKVVDSLLAIQRHRQEHGKPPLHVAQVIY
ncbi:hypothetical protein Hypma_010713 [Hypsizygus marmoreus]|uniref:Uncharacterized protein n=1 Tax=Hypsizygus marmoreus TaxID=39966 RepID=A0A369JIU6_HYPMA|nr:hypothetical protein Hypma_010713 [Hypsizygus marmoreus]